MADNFVTDAGSGGDTFGADDVGGVKFPRLKVILGADGTNSGDMASGAGAVGATVPRVTLASDDPAVVDLAAIEVLLTGIDADTDAIKTDAAAIEVLLTTIDADTSSLAGCVGGTELQVDVVSSALPTGAATAANQTTLIGHVDGVETLLAGGLPAALGAGGGLKVDGSGTALPVSGTVTVQDGGGAITVDGTVTVQLASAQTLATVTTVGTVTTITNVVHVDDNSGSLTVDGTVAATQSGTWNIGTVTAVTGITNAVTVQATNLDIRDLTSASDSVAAVCTNAGTFATQVTSISAGDNNIGNVDVVTLPSANLGQQAMAASLSVVPASNITDATYIGDIKFGESLPAGTNAIGKLAANSGVDIGDVDVTSIAAGTNTIGGVISQASTSIGYDGTTACTIKRASGVATGSGANTVLAAVADKKFRVLALSLLATSTTAVSLYLYNGDNNLLGDGTNKLTLDLDGGSGPAGVVLPYNQGGWFQTDTANELLGVNLSGATPVIWAITYIEVA